MNKCSECAYLQDKQCRRYPPTLIAMSNGYKGAEYPLINSGEGCGEFMLDLGRDTDEPEAEKAKPETNSEADNSPERNLASDGEREAGSDSKPNPGRCDVCFGSPDNHAPGCIRESDRGPFVAPAYSF